MSSRVLAPLLAVLLVSALPGCPEPTESTTAAPPAGGPPPADGAAPPADGAAPPADGAAPPADGAAPPADGAAPPADGAPVSDPGGMIRPVDLAFSRFIKPDDKTVKLTIRVEGAAEGKIDLLAMSEKDGVTLPTVLHTEAFSGGAPLVVTAPATYPDPIYVSAIVKVEKSGKDDPMKSGPVPLGATKVGGAPEAIKLAGKDVEVTVKLGTHPKWLEKLASQSNAPPPSGEGAPPPGPPPAGEGAPPAGAPPSGGTPPAPPPGGAATGTPPALPTPAPK